MSKEFEREGMELLRRVRAHAKSPLNPVSEISLHLAIADWRFRAGIKVPKLKR